MGAAGGPDRAGAVPARSGGPYPLVVFSDGYDISPEAYATLLDAWTVAGYVVADPVYPFTAPTSPGGLKRSDIVNHPNDLTFVISSLLGDSAAAAGTLTGMIDSHEVGAIGHSDGGDVSLAAASNTCCRNSLVKAAIILSGAELAWFPGTYYSPPAVPVLAVQGTNDTVNPPSCSVQLYNHAPQPKYYLAMAGQTHTSAYTQAGQPLDVVAKVTTDFLNGYLKGSAAGIKALATDGTVAGLASLTNAASVPPDDRPCPDAPIN
jgi:cephalosporin-C deacetylase-like acetyl esterase